MNPQESDPLNHRRTNYQHVEIKEASFISDDNLLQPLVPYHQRDERHAEQQQHDHSSPLSRKLTHLKQKLINTLSKTLFIFVNEEGDSRTVTKGVLLVFLLGSIIGILAPKDPQLRTVWYPYISSMIGYTYFVAWSISFYPQVFLNYRRKSTTGLSTDFVMLNLIGFMCYSAFNCSFFWNKAIQRDYAQQNNGASLMVQSNDVVFSLHAAVLTMVTLFQIGYYNGFTMAEEGRPSSLAFLLALALILLIVTYAILIAALENTSDGGRHLNWLSFLYFLASVKVFITITKYIPQVLLNCRRRSTKGWNIWNILLDFTGGLLSIIQLVFDCWNLGEWSGITGNLAKFMLGFVSITFDIIFMLQHYVLYPHNNNDNNDCVEPLV